MSFWIVVAALLAVALIILVLPILRQPRDDSDSDRQAQNIQIAREKKQVLDQQLAQAEVTQAEYDSLLQDLETALAIDLERSDETVEKKQGKWAIVLVIVLVPVCSISLYMKLGEYRVIDNPQLAEAVQRPQAQNQNMSIEEMLERVKQRLRDNPEDAEGWFIMGRTYLSMQKFDEAVTAFQRTYDLVGEAPGVMFTLADALALQNGGSMAGEPTELVRRGLEISPQDPTGLWLAGLAAEQRQEYKLAHAHWAEMLPLIADDEASSDEVRRLLAILEKRDPGIQPVTAPETLVAAVSISLNVDLDAALRSQVSAQDSVFIYAKAMQGPPMPLAVKRLTVADLPVSVSLSDSDAMMPNMKLSSFAEVIVGARVSKSGNPVAQPGDLFVEVGSIDSKNPPATLSLMIDQVK